MSGSRQRCSAPQFGYQMRARHTPILAQELQNKRLFLEIIHRLKRFGFSLLNKQPLWQVAIQISQTLNSDPQSQIPNPKQRWRCSGGTSGWRRRCGARAVTAASWQVRAPEYLWHV